MEILGIGPLELVFIFIIILIVLGPKDMAKAGQTMGRFLHKVITSDWWRTITRASQEMRNLPTNLIREAGLEEDLVKMKSDWQEAGLDRTNIDPYLLSRNFAKEIGEFPEDAPLILDTPEGPLVTSRGLQAPGSETPPAEAPAQAAGPDDTPNQE